MIRLKKVKISLLLLLLPGVVLSQQFKYKCALDVPDTSGFYAILIAPEMSGHVKTDLSDIRIRDSKGQWVPHLVRTEDKERQQTERNIDLKVLTLEYQPQKSIVIVENGQRKLLNNLLLRFKNAAAERMTSLSGSEDNKKWFIISDSIYLTQALVITGDESVIQIRFPSTEYSYLKLTIRNSGKDPLNLQAVTSIVEGPDTTLNPLENPTPIFKQVDSSKWSLIHLDQIDPFQIDQLMFQVRQPALYERTARVYLERKDGILQTWESSPLAEIKISSASNLAEALPLVRTKDLFIVISNEDNPALKINSIKTFQPARELITYLEKGMTYELLFDDSEARAPNYDLKEFAGKVPAHPQSLRVRDCASMPIGATKPEKKTSPWWIWITIIGVILVLAYLTWQLTREMSRKNKVS